MAIERGFRNSLAISLLLVGIALVFYSLGSVLEFVANIATFNPRADGYDAVFRILVLTIAFLYFFIGLSLIRSRPRYDTPIQRGAPEPAAVAAPGAFTAAGLFSIILVLFSAIFLFDFTAYGKNPVVAAALLLAGIFGYASTMVYRRPDPNISAVGAICALIAGGLLLYAQVAIPLPSKTSNTYGTWETTHYVMPPILGPVAVLIAGVAGLVHAYVSHRRFANVSFLVLSVAGLVYGLGLCLVGLTSVFNLSWYQFSTTTGNSMLQLLSMTAGTALLVAGGVACIVAALMGVVRSGQHLKAPPEETRTPSVVTTTAQPITPSGGATEELTVTRTTTEEPVAGAVTSEGDASRVRTRTKRVTRRYTSRGQ
jgi:hypothetical protein